jgi:predicted DNA-binding antitoxin AbrB/MazE fold protein
MTISIRAVFENGTLRPLVPLDLVEGEEIEINIVTERDRAIAVLGDLLVDASDPNDEDVDEVAMMQEIQEAFRGQRPLSESIIEERREGP